MNNGAENNGRSTDSRSIANLKPWQPGQSGNPGGRKKITAKFAMVKGLAAN